MRAYRTEGLSLRNSRRNQGWRRKASQERGRRRLSAHLERLEDRAMMATIDVTTFTDVVDAGDGYISLREAINTANSNGANDTINLPAGTYTLSLTGTAEDNNVRGDLDLKESGKTITFVGAGSGSTIIDANLSDRVFHAQSGVAAVIEGITIREGKPISGSGGGLYASAATVTLNDCILTANEASNGAAIYATNSSITLNSSTVTANTATTSGGGIYITDGVGSASLTIDDSTLSYNIASSGHGGAILADTVTLTIADSLLTENEANSSSGQGGAINIYGVSPTAITDSSITNNVAQRYGGAIYISNSTNTTHSQVLTRVVVSGNSVVTGNGGAIFASNTRDNQTFSILDSTFANNEANGSGSYGSGGAIRYSGKLEISGSAFYGNIAEVSGGAIYHTSTSTKTLTIANSTISDNDALGGSSTGIGGGVVVNGSGGGIATFMNVTIANNSANYRGGGVYVASNPTFNAKNSLFGGNTAVNSGPQIYGTLDSLGYNLIQNTTGATIVGTTTGNQLNVDPLLGSLQDNGGLTWTHALAYNSPALDAGTNTGAPSTDQRGVSRPQDGDDDSTATTDIGAFEFRYNHAPANSVPGSQSTDEDTPLTFSSGNSNLISISDADAGSEPVQVTLTGTNGAVTLSGLTGLTFSTGDGTADATMTFTGTITDTNAALAGLQFLPTGDYSGSASLEIVTNDLNAGSDGSAQSDTDSVSITVNAVNDAPNRSAGSPSAVSVNEDSSNSSAVTLGLSGLNYGPGGGSDESGQTLTYQVTSIPAHITVWLSDGTTHVAANTTVTLGELQGLKYKTVADAHGTANLSWTVQDNGGTSNGGVDTLTENLAITVDAVNDAPVNSVPDVQTFDEDTTLTFSSGNGNLISISDIDAASSAVQVTLTVTHGTLSLSGTTGLSFTVGDGTDDATMTFTGTMTDINAALANSVYTPTTDYFGSASLEIITNDQGNTGSGGAQSDTDEVEFTIEEVDTPPYVLHPIYDLLVVENAPNTFIALNPYFDDADIIPFDDSLTYTVQANDNTGLVTTTIVGNVLKLVYDADNTGVAEITIRATDEFDEYVDETFTVTVGSGCCGGSEEMEMMMGGGSGSGSGFGYSSSLESLSEDGEKLFPSGGGSGGAFLVVSFFPEKNFENDCPGCPTIKDYVPKNESCCSDSNDPGAGLSEGNPAASPQSSINAKTGEAFTLANATKDLSLLNNPPDNPHPIISATYPLPDFGSVPLMVEAKLTLGGIEGDSVFFDTSGLSNNDIIQISLQIDASALTTGFYEYTIDFTEHYASSTATDSLTDRYAIHNRSTSEFGNRWWLPELDVLDIQAGGVGLLRGNSTGAWFESDGFGGFESSEVSFATLELDENDWYTVTTQWGDQSIFDDCGRLRLRIDANGNTTTYAYWDAREDGSADEIAFITRPDGRTTSFFYTDELLASMTDEAGNVTTFTYVDGRLTAITYPDPDGEGSLEAPETTFTYTTEGWLESYTDTDGKTASFEYDFAGRIAGGENPDGSTWTLTPEIIQTLVDPTSGLGTDTNPAPALLAADVHAEYSGPGGVENTVRTDSFGQPIYELDALGNEWSWTWDDQGRMLTQTTPDPDDTGPLGPQTTTYTYGSLSLPLTVTYADSTTETWTYDSTFQRMTSHTDRLGRVTLWEIDSANGNVLSETRVVGELDDEINEETDDVVTTYTYTDGSGGIPAGMPLTITDPLGRVTLFNYYGDPESHDFARLHYVTVAYGEVGVAAATFFEYDAAGNIIEITDPLGRVTTYTYDALNRLVAMTQPDPDGAGELESPVWTYEYTAGGDLQFETDPLGNVLEYVYDDQHRVIGRIFADPDGAGPLESPEIEYTIDDRNFVTEIVDALGRLTTYEFDDLGRLLSETLPDPDGGGALTAPETTYTYDAVGNLATVTDALGNATSYRYDTMNRLVELTLADPDGGGALTAPVTEYDYDDAGQLIAMTDPLGRVTEYEYDTLGRLVKLTLPDPDGVGGDPAPETDYAYDKAGNLLSVTDSLGNVTTYAYDARNRLLSVTQPDPDGGGALAAPETTYTYDAASQFLTVTDPLGRETSYEYDGLGRLVSVTLPDPDGGGALESPVTTFAYDAVGNLLVETDALGNETAYAYDNLYRLIEVTQADPDGGGAQTSPVTTYEYDSMGQLLSMTDPLGRETTYTYDNLGRMLTTTLPDPDAGGAQTAPVTTFEYDAVGNLLSVTDALGNETAYAYDDLHRLLTVTQADPDGGGAQTSPVTTYEYDSASQLVSITDPLGRETAFAYDGLGRQISVTQPDPDGGGAQTSPVTTYDYDLAGNLLTVTDALGNATAYEYDNLYRLIEVTQADPDGGGAQTSPVTTYEYDVASQLLSVTDPLGRETTYTYDNLGRQLTVTQPDPDGVGGVAASFTTYEYDAVGNVLVVGDALSHEYAYEYDNLHRRIRTTDPNATDTLFTYDAVGNLLSLEDPNENVTTWVYDGLNRAIEETNELNDTRYFEYDAVGNLVEKTDRLGRVTQYEYDALHRLTAENWLDGMSTIRTLSFEYDSAGQLTAASDPSAEYAFVYDDLGRATIVTADIAGLASTVVLTQAFNAVGNRTDLKAEIEGEDDFANEYLYDDLHRLTRVTQQSQGGGYTVAAKRADFAYNALGQFDTIDRYYGTGTSDPVATSTYGYDDANRLTDLDHAQGATALAGYEFTYDLANRITGIANTQHAAETATFTYDNFGQLTAADRSSTPNDEAYTYDDNGNREEANGDTYTVDTNNRITSDGVFTYAYDAEGNRILKTEISSGDYVEYEWDYRNRLTAVGFYDDTDVLQKRVEYEYDLFDRRVVKRVDADGDTDFDEGQFFAYDGAHIALVFDDAGSLTNRYLHGPVIDQILADEQVHWDAIGEDYVTDAMLWALADHLGTVRDVAEYDPGTDTTTVENHLVIDSFGRITSETNSSVLFVFAFTGREWDADVDLYYYRARYFTIDVAQFISEDPIGFRAQDPNLRRYVGNSPTSATDPSGFVEFNPWGVGTQSDTGSFETGNTSVTWNNANARHTAFHLALQHLHTSGGTKLQIHVTGEGQYYIGPIPTANVTKGCASVVGENPVAFPGWDKIKAHLDSIAEGQDALDWFSQNEGMLISMGSAGGNQGGWTSEGPMIGLSPNADPMKNAALFILHVNRIIHDNARAAEIQKFPPGSPSEPLTAGSIRNRRCPGSTQQDIYPIANAVVEGGVAMEALLSAMAASANATGRAMMQSPLPTAVARKVSIDPDKLKYIFGEVTSGTHNTARSLQNVRQMNRIGVPSQQAILRHLERVGKNPGNVVRTFHTTLPNGRVITQEVRESLLSGPGGFLQLQSTWEVLVDGTRRFTSVIPFGG